MTLTVPTRSRPKKAWAPKKESVPPMGNHTGTIASVAEAEDGGYEITFSFKAEGRTWSHPHPATEKELLDILVVLGMGGRNVELADLAGTPVTIQVATFGGRTSAKVESIQKPDA